MGKKNFLIEKKWKKMIANLPDDKAGQLIKAIFNHADGEDVVIDDPVLSAVFFVIQEEMDENERLYEAECQKRREAANKRWEKQRKDDVTEDMQDDASASLSIQNDASASMSMKKPCTSIHEDADARQDHNHNHKKLNLTEKEKDISARARENPPGKKQKAQIDTRNRFNRFKQHDYDFDAIKASLVADGG